MFSIVIPLYNKEQSVTNTLQSVLNQTFTEFEVVIINDGSTDRSVEVVEGFNDPRIRLIHQKNQGVSAARNKGIKEANYEWICFLDADDLWRENHLSTLRNMIETYPEYKAFCNSFIRSSEEINQNNEIVFKVIDDYFKEGLKSFFFWTSVVCIHKTVFDVVGVFNVKLTRGEDLELWMKIGKEFTVVKSNIITAIYNQESENKLMNNKGVPIDKCLESHLNFNDCSGFERTYLKMLAINKIKSLFKTFRCNDAFYLLYKYNINLFK